MMEEKETLNSARRGNWWRFLPLILWMAVIFYSSTGNASMAKTSRFLRPLLEMFFSSEDTIHLVNIIIRKIAHLAYYSILAAVALFAVVGSPIDWLRKNWFAASFAIVLVMATIDEIIQSFDSSRIGSVSDVLLDCAGGLIILLFCKFFLPFAKNNH